MKNSVVNRLKFTVCKAIVSKAVMRVLNSCALCHLREDENGFLYSFLRCTLCVCFPRCDFYDNFLVLVGACINV